MPIAWAASFEIEVIRAESERGSREPDPDVHELIYKGYAAMFDAATSGLPALRQAEKYFTQALDRDPENPRAQTGLGGYHAVMALQLRVPDPVPYLAKADAILQQVIEQHPNTSEAHHYLGLVHVTRGQPEKAARSFERAIEINSSCAPCYGQLGRALVRMGRPAEGLEHLHYAMRLSPRDPSMPNWLGMAGGAELELEHYDKAIEYLDRALAFDAGQPRICWCWSGPMRWRATSAKREPSSPGCRRRNRTSPANSWSRGSSARRMDPGGCISERGCGLRWRRRPSRSRGRPRCPLGT